MNLKMLLETMSGVGRIVVHVYIKRGDNGVYDNKGSLLALTLLEVKPYYISFTVDTWFFETDGLTVLLKR